MFKNRKEAGRKLGRLLQKYKTEKPLILALPRGGVIVGYEVAKKLKAPLNVIISRKLPSPRNPEYGVGAVSENAFYINRDIAREEGLERDQLVVLAKLQEDEVKKRVRRFRKGRKLPDLKKQTVILVDDGLATGGTAFAAIEAIKKFGTKKIIFAAPVCDARTVRKIKQEKVFVNCILYPNLSSVGSYYQNFTQVTDEEVIKILGQKR